MTLEELATRLTALLDAADVPYMVVGSLASSCHGEPRMTRDLDVVIDPTPAGLDLLVAGLVDAGLYADADAARRALADRTQFNVVDPDSGWKVDMIIRKDRPFSREEFARRLDAELPIGRIQVATAEDNPRQARVGSGWRVRAAAARCHGNRGGFGTSTGPRVSRPLGRRVGRPGHLAEHQARPHTLTSPGVPSA